MGTVQVITTHITPFGLDRAVHIYLPDGWDTDGQRYPVMYMYDGHNLFFDSYATFGKSWGMKEFLDQWDKKIIVVGLECNHEGEQRLEEFSPYPIEEAAYWPEITGSGGILMDWLVEELKPYIDANYPTIPFRECTAIGGSSMGGLMSVFTIAKYNRWFSKAACLSSSLEPVQDYVVSEIEAASIDPDTRVFLSWGSNELSAKSAFARATRRNLDISRLLTARGARTWPYLHYNGRHCEADWAKEVPLFMEYLWKAKD